ncbi:hypothetical protein L2E82_10011 [Cichorium intybus]|uniref:Uncharacterized protein n=1 Tax=Cichorium intybus TaxID=13427 RepID=A0ACB9GAL0_CICIN|nr:hypothetical protein L2E82_10011 [Cichorium intybus]
MMRFSIPGVFALMSAMSCPNSRGQLQPTEGYAVTDLTILNPSKGPDICLSKFVTLLLQSSFTAASFTAAGCYLCPAPAPGSKGTKLLICCSVNSTLPLKMESFYVRSFNEKVNFSSELDQIIENGNFHLNKMVLNASDVPFLNTKSSDSILTEAKRVNILSEPTFTSICSLHKTELEKF